MIKKLIFFRQTYISRSHSCKASESNDISYAKKTKSVVKMRTMQKKVVKMKSKNTFLKAVINFVFLHRAQVISFDSETLHECEQLIYACLQKISDFLIMFFDFLVVSKISGAYELGVPKRFSPTEYISLIPVYITYTLCC